MTDSVPPRTSWSPGVVGPAVRIAGGLLGLALAALAGGGPSSVLVGAAGVLLLVTGIGGFTRRPRLELVDDDLVLARLRGRLTVPRHDVVEVRVLRLSRLVGRSRVLRIEYVVSAAGAGPAPDTELVVLTGADLGTDPRDVADTLARRGFPVRDDA